MVTPRQMQTEAVPRFSIIVPTRNEQADIAATLRALLALEHPAFEVLVEIGRAHV